MPDRLAYRVGDVAALYGVSESTARRWFATRLASYRVGGCLFATPESVLAIAQEGYDAAREGSQRGHDLAPQVGAAQGRVRRRREPARRPAPVAHGADAGRRQRRAAVGVQL